MRRSARVLVIDEEDRLLLFQGLGLGDIPVLWVPPGGGLEPWESYEEAALRELGEEIGLRDVSLGPCVWHRSIVFRWEKELIDSHERFFVCRVPGLDISAHVNPDEVERSLVLGHRWWRLDELAAARDEVFVPRELASLLGPILRGEYAARPLEIGA